MLDEKKWFPSHGYTILIKILPGHIVVRDESVDMRQKRLRVASSLMEFIRRHIEGVDKY